jgi:hypothetical protein
MFRSGLPRRLATLGLVGGRSRSNARLVATNASTSGQTPRPSRLRPRRGIASTRLDEKEAGMPKQVYVFTATLVGVEAVRRWWFD